MAGPADSDAVAGHGASRVTRNVAAMAGGQAVTWSMSLLWTLVVPRALGPAGMGVIVTAWSVTGVLGVVLGLGTRNYLVREMVVRRTEAPRLLGTAIVLRIALAPLFAAAAAAYAELAHVDHDARVVLGSPSPRRSSPRSRSRSRPPSRRSSAWSTSRTRR